MKVLNLYAGIGGNRKLWNKENTGLDLEITAVEMDPNIAKIYKDFFPDDNVIVGDAHQYLLDHYNDGWGFIWTSRPCRSHSKTIFWNHVKKQYPDLVLYEEIIFLKHFFYGKWVSENVIPYYKPLIQPQIIDRHAFWANFFIPKYSIGEVVRNDKGNGIKVKQEKRGLIVSDWYDFKGDKRQILNNCVYPELGLHIFKSMNNQELKLAI